MHNYAVPTLEKILAEDRKYGLGLVLATQYLEQMPQDVLGAIMGNANTVAPAARRAVGAGDGGWLKPDFSEHDCFATNPSWWADGIYLKAGLGKEKTALLVLIGVNEKGEKELLAVAEGYRESTES